MVTTPGWFRRHPSGLELGAQFDGEGTREVGTHTATCSRCQGRLNEMRRVRAAMRGEPIPSIRTATMPVPVIFAGVRRPVLAPLVLGLAMALFALTVGPLRAPISDAGRSIFTQRDDQPTSQPGTGGPAGRKAAGAHKKRTGSANAPKTPTTMASPPAPSVVPGFVPPPPRGPDSAAPAPTSPPPVPFRVGIVVPTSGALAGEGADATRAVREAARAANAAGGILGRPIDVVVAASEDPHGLASLKIPIDVVVGGFGAEPATPGTAPPVSVAAVAAKASWLLPADPGVTGATVVSAELEPRAAGARLGRDLLERHVEGPVAVVTGTGPDAALAQGLGEVVRTTSETAKPGTSCDQELTDLRKADANPAALAVAGSPELAASCVEAAIRLGLKPPGGILLAPSAAYSGLDHSSAANGARTMLGLPWPGSDSAGAERFRKAVPGTGSYRAMVSFAATELAVQVARGNAGHPIAVRDVANGKWRSDLYALDGTANQGAAVVVLGDKGWVAAPAGAPPRPAGEGTAVKPPATPAPPPPPARLPAPPIAP